MALDNPLVSIFINCKNGASTVRRAIEAVLGQSYPFIECVFQDGGSTDGTVDIVFEYIKKNPGRIKLFLEPDSSPYEGFFRALRNCTGEIVGSSMCDEELLPDAATNAVENFRLNPSAGAIYGDTYITDLHGNVSGSWISKQSSLKGHLCREVDPPFVTAFFRKEALESIGLHTRQWYYGAGEFELWLRLFMRFPITYFPGFVAKYSVSHTSLSNAEFKSSDFIALRKTFLEKFFSESDLPYSIKKLKKEALAGLHLHFAQIQMGLGDYESANSQILEAMGYKPNKEKLLETAYKLERLRSKLDDSLLKKHISDHLSVYLNSQRIVCYGVGRDFMSIISAGLFRGHNVVAVIDNIIPSGVAVSGVPVIDLCSLIKTPHDILVITSSHWYAEFRKSVLKLYAENNLSNPII